MTPTVPAGEWNDLLARASGATPFHRHELLSVVADHAGATFYPMVGYRDDRPVGLFPVFERSVGPASALFSPAPDLKVQYLGPLVLDDESAASRTRERRHCAFVDAALDCFERRFHPVYTHVRTGPAFRDPRPFAWRGFDVRPEFSYAVDLRPDADDLLASFSSDARQNVRNAPEECDVSEGGPDAIERIIEQVRARHAEQNESYLVTPAFVRDLYESLPVGTVRPYEVRLDGEFVGGMVALEDDDTVYRWQGGAKPDVDAPVNDVLDWHIMQSAADRGVVGYDLVGANNERIARYKAKFAPELVPFYSLVETSLPMKAVSELYKRFR